MPPKSLADWEKALPPPPAPAGTYAPWVLTGELLYTSGVLPMQGGKLAMAGKVGKDLTVEQGVAAARLAGLNALAVTRAALGTLLRVRRIVQVVGFVASAPGFTDQAKVMNGATDLFVEVFGDRGRPTRISVGAAELPLNAPVELALVAEVDTIVHGLAP